MTLEGILLILFILLLLGARPARRNSWNEPDLNWYNGCFIPEQMGRSQYAKGNRQQEIINMNILEHSDKGATIKLDQRELLLVMALVQEGRESFGCNTESGKALDELFSSANRLVEEARRRNVRQLVVRQPVVRQKIHSVAGPAHVHGNAASNR